jgi:hypothetical protein
VKSAPLLLLLVSVCACSPAGPQDITPTSAPQAAVPPATPAASSPASTANVPGYIYGRVTAVDGETFQGRLRWGGEQEAFWTDYFNGAKNRNPWAAHAPSTQPSGQRTRIEIFGFEIGGRLESSRLHRLFMARFGDLARIDAQFREVQVRLKSGTIVTLDRFAAGDIDDGVRVWDGARGVVDVDARRIRTIEFLPATIRGAAPNRLHGTVHTRQGDFTGFIQWDQQDSIGSDELTGRAGDSERRIRFDAIRSIERRSVDSVLVTDRDGRQVVLSNDREVGKGNRGIYVDDVRYSRVLVSWNAFERVEFDAAGSGPAYEDFPPGHGLTGRVTTHDGGQFAGRLVYDFDESETTETLDASLAGIDYNIPFALIRSVVPRGREASRATVILRDRREELQLERTGDLGDGNAGMLIFADGRDRPEFVPWANVERVDLDSSSSGSR